MSCFIISNATMDRVIYGIMGTLTPHDTVFADVFIPADSSSEQALRLAYSEIGKALFKVNIQAYDYRYDEDSVKGEILYSYRGPIDRRGTYRIRDYPQNWAEYVAAYKAMQCWIYQCSEGPIVNNPLYREVEERARDLAEHLIRLTPAYDEAPWDAERSKEDEHPHVVFTLYPSYVKFDASDGRSGSNPCLDRKSRDQGILEILHGLGLDLSTCTIEVLDCST